MITIRPAHLAGFEILNRWNARTGLIRFARFLPVNHDLVDLLGRYSNWTFWADRAQTLPPIRTNRPQLAPVTRGSARRLTEDEVTDLVTRYQAGASVYDLAADLKIHRATVSEHLHRAGVTMRRRSLDACQVDQATRLYKQGWSVARIGAELGVDGGTVWLALRAAGVRMRDTHGRER